MDWGIHGNTGERYISAADSPGWESSESIEGLEVRELWAGESGASISVLRFKRGHGIGERHRHASNQFMYCLSGRYQYMNDGPTLQAGDFYMNPKGNLHGPTVALEDSVLLEIYDGPHYLEEPDGNVGNEARIIGTKDQEEN